MPPITKRTVSVDLPDALVRRAARHVGPRGFSSIVEQALLMWLDERDAKQNGRRPGYGLAGTSSRETV